ncbi:MAG: 16S rRNA (uracil(1498)-N(3))-methyltransferase [Clostridia bacterium]|nr:16S rRNA (uracil(1498)-N(3))-methyltransferase [Clostridia bacterium]
MPRFFIQREQIADGVVTLLGDDAHHVSRSLRMAVGERITVCDMQKIEYECELTDFLPDRVLAKVLSSVASETEPPFHAHVFQALPKGEKLDSVIQKAVECGASELTVFESERCIARIKEGNDTKKRERWQRIVLEAAKQSGRGTVPTVHPTTDFTKAIHSAADADLALFCYEGDGTRPLAEVLREQTALQDFPKHPRISIMIGSEGGFSLKEAERAREAGWIPVGLGKRILRTETAASFVLACLVYELELKG